MTRKLRVAVLFGGRSGEHDVSLLSAASILQAIDRERFEAVPVAITRDGVWLRPLDLTRTLTAGISREDGRPVTLVGGPAGAALVALDDGPAGVPPGEPVDVVFPVLHGPFGEDGAVQGLLELANVPYVGCGVLASALGMDKGIMKDVFRQKGLPVVDYLVLKRRDWECDPGAVRRRIEEALGYPCFVKPANLGSSVGISKVRGPVELAPALDLAGRYDRRIIVERGVDAREIECGVLGNDEPLASVPGEIIPAHEFYDYDAKYASEGTRLLIPAPIPGEVGEQVRELAIRAFLALDCAGMARVDFFLERGSGRILVNEINTIPGFTAVSMYPKLWEATGLPYQALITRLIELGLERWRERDRSPAGGTPLGPLAGFSRDGA